MEETTEKTILIDAMHTLFQVRKGFDEAFLEVLDSFQERKIILTNADTEEIQRLFDVIPYEIFTLSHKPNKSDGGYYERFLEQYSLKPEQCLYIDDEQVSLEKAEALGIKTLLFDKDKRDLEEVREFLQNNLTNS